MESLDHDSGWGPPPVTSRSRSWVTGSLALLGFGLVLLAAACSGGDAEEGVAATAPDTPTEASSTPADTGDEEATTTVADDGDTTDYSDDATDASDETADDSDDAGSGDLDDVADLHGARLVAEGRDTFRNDTFGSEAFFGGVLQLHDAIQGEERGGFGPGVSPETALAVGLKVDLDRLPPEVQEAAAAGEVDLTDTATTMALLELDAVVGVDGQFGDDGTLTSIGITCALCHSTVDDAFAPGIGHRLDGWANRDLNVGAILNLAPDSGAQAVADILHVDVPTVRTVLQSWGPGKFDASLLIDGKAFRPDGESGAVLIPPAYGLAGVNLATWTGWGSVTHWNAFVGNLEMHGSGTFYDPRLADAEQFPVAAEQGYDNVRPATPEDDLITSKLAALHFYQLAIPAPEPPDGSFDADAAARGEAIFAGEAGCATCHVPPLFTEPGFNAHTPEEIGIDSFQADRSPTGMYRTSPLPGVWTNQDSGYYHDGRFASLLDVVEHYDTVHALGLSDDQKLDLVEYLKSL